MSCGERMKLVREKQGLTQAVFGEPLGLSQENIKDIEIGRKKVTPEIALKIDQVYGIDFKWLLTGAGEPRQGLQSTTNEYIGTYHVPYQNDPQIMEMVAIMKRLDSRAKEDLVRQAEKEELLSDIKKSRGMKPLGEAGIIGINFLIQMLVPLELILVAVGYGIINGQTARIALNWLPCLYLIILAGCGLFPVTIIKYLKCRAVSLVRFRSLRFGGW